MEEQLEVLLGEKNGAAVAPSPPAKLSREEQLTLENYSLKAENLRLQRELLKRDLDASTKMLVDLHKETQEFGARLKVKYGIDLATAKIDRDGSIHPQ